MIQPDQPHSRLMDDACVDIVVATYNAGPWLDVFLNSLLTQDFERWRVIIRDDCSTDGTGRTLEEWKSRLADRFCILPDSGTRNVGVTVNFSILLSAAETQWVMMADQDDIWLPAKISKTLHAMQEAENTLGSSTPIAICTDAEVMDTTGQSVAPSYWRWNRMKLDRVSDVHRVAMESVALGCTMMVNRALLQLALPIDERAPYHDWWLAMVSAAFGRLIPLNETTIRYRRHGGNVTADPYSSSAMGAVRRILQSPRAPRLRLQRLIGEMAIQSRAFTERYRDSLRESDATALDSLAHLPSLGPVERRLALFQHDLWFSSPIKNLGLLALL